MSSAMAAEVKKLPTFKKADLDGNSFVDESEFAKAKTAKVKKSFAELDKDKDGMLSKKEYSVLMDEDCE